ncbi:hypothetical protein CGZ93_10060 [Enemella dayhoffiae]|uniref:DUF3043 domain-containing protein n=1 Tax=Enemella dayhoffiae TaxID=2016507 RepID=A0A255H1R3_9ACTN|nr:DUF3043 domain-containing protein [Enemella dayhoffiae]OYO21635.1 hypothetical protein CGZ93_10060 [Enemella dayhoffiae]
MGLFRPYRKDVKSDPAVSDPEPTPEPLAKGPRKKDAPTPTRRQAEAARKERLNPTLSPKEARRQSAAANRERRMAAMEARDSTPEKQLMRDMVDARWNLGEFLLPAMVLMLALSFLQSVYPQMSMIALVAMYGFLALVLLDLFLLWGRYKKLLAQKHPGVSTKGKGLMMYGFNRSIQMRRLRMPKPTIARGTKL